MNTLQIILIGVWILCAASIGFYYGYYRGIERTYKMLTESLEEIYKTTIEMTGRNNDGSD